MRKAFNFYRSYYDVFKELSEKDKVLFITALLEKQFDGKEPDLKGMANFAYLSQKHSIDAQVLGFETKTGIKLHPRQGGMVGGSVGASVQEKEKGEEKEKNNSVNFSFFWELYPRKEGKKKAEEKWYKLSPEKQNKILSTLPLFLKGKETKFVPMPVTYFNNERWEDEIIIKQENKNGYVSVLSEEEKKW